MFHFGSEASAISTKDLSLEKRSRGDVDLWRTFLDRVDALNAAGEEPNPVSLRYVVIDFETSGLSPREGDRVIEVAAVEILAGKIGKSYQSLVCSGSQISEKIS